MNSHQLTRSLILAAMCAASLLGQYKAWPAGAPPPEASAIASSLVQDGLKVEKPGGAVLCEIWLVPAEPTGGTAQQNATMQGAMQGALLGVVRYPARASDRRGQTIKPGVYTLRYSNYPMNGDHMGVAPQRDFAVLSPIAIDSNPTATPAFDTLMDMSRKASGTPHPLVLSIWKDDAGATPGMEQQGENDQVLHTKLGSMPFAMIVFGKHEE